MESNEIEKAETTDVSMFTEIDVKHVVLKATLSAVTTVVVSVFASYLIEKGASKFQKRRALKLVKSETIES
jgi:hypothetical protein